MLALNSSPSMEKGFTAMILNPFIEGMREKGANVELLYTRKLDIRPCMGCLSCHIKTPRKCIQDDDAATIHSKLSKADIAVLACPLYVFGFPGPMKNLLDRILPNYDAGSRKPMTSVMGSSLAGAEC